IDFLTNSGAATALTSTVARTAASAMPGRGRTLTSAPPCLGEAPRHVRVMARHGETAPGCSPQLRSRTRRLVGVHEEVDGLEVVDRPVPDLESDGDAEYVLARHVAVARLGVAHEVERVELQSQRVGAFCAGVRYVGSVEHAPRPDVPPTHDIRYLNALVHELSTWLLPRRISVPHHQVRREGAGVRAIAQPDVVGGVVLAFVTVGSPAPPRAQTGQGIERCWEAALA